MTRFRPENIYIFTEYCVQDVSEIRIKTRDTFSSSERFDTSVNSVPGILRYKTRLVPHSNVRGKSSVVKL